MKEKTFVYGMSVEGANFTDREQETKRMVMDFKNGINVILISPDIVTGKQIGRAHV